MSFMNKLSKRVKSPLASAKEHSAESSGTVDTGCLPLNAILSGSLYGGVQSNKITAIAGDPATGKAQPLLSKIKTPAGWIEIGRISVGDEISCPDGSVSKVVGVYPQGVKKVYEIEFMDGRKTQCCDEHLWKITTHQHGKGANGKGKKYHVDQVVTLEWLRNTDFRQRKIGIPLIKHADLPDKTLPIDPYLLGVLIGDGGMTGTNVTVTSADDEIIQKISGLGFTVTKIKNDKYGYRIKGLLDTIRSLGLDVKSQNKFIPNGYLEGTSLSQKIALIRGLCDTDGYVDASGSLSYTTTSERLKNNFVYLIRSIGGVAYVCHKEVNRFTDSDGNKKDGLPSWTIFVRYSHKSELVSLSRKKTRIINSVQKYNNSNLKIKSIRFVGEEECVCIAVDHPEHLYITDDFIVTHNTFFALSIAKHFLDSNPDAGVMYIDTEAAITSDMLEDRGVDSTRVIINESSTIQDFRKSCLDALDEYEKEYGKTPKEERPPFMIILDSLGMLSSAKEVEDSVKGNDTRDMTKAQLIRGVFRVLTLKMAKLDVPMIVTVHTYDTMSMYTPKEMSGGSGLKYAASTILFLSKSKDQNTDKEIVGNFIKVRAHKSRFTKENSEVKLRLSFTTGLDKYYGLLDLAEKYEIFKKLEKNWEMPDGSKVYEKAIYSNPEKYFTEDVMKKLEEAAAKEFLYGSGE